VKTLTPLINYMVYSPDEFEQFVPAHFSHLLEHTSDVIRRILQDMGQWADNTASEKLLIRRSFDLIERFMEDRPFQFPCRPTLLLDGYICAFFGRAPELHDTIIANPILYRFLDALLTRAVVTRDALICLFYHWYGMKPVKVGCLLGLEKGQMQRIYKNFARWRQKGWIQVTEETGLSARELQSLEASQKGNPEYFNKQVRGHLEILLPFYRKSDPPYYHCLEGKAWQEMFSEGYGLDYRMWHLPLCLSCMNAISRFGDRFPNPEITLNFQVCPYSEKQEGTIGTFLDGAKIMATEKVPQRFSQDLQPA
jgi:hypothetical protein